MPMLESALIYASWGWHVHPLRPGDKRPLLKDWPRQATTDAAQIRRWWARWPEANIGLACGPSRLLAIDLDVRQGVDGIAAWQRLKAELGIDDAGTPASQTPGGGRHVLFALEAEAAPGNSAGKLAPGIDTRGDGGYIVLPPSRLAGGGAWTWRPEAHPRACEPAPLPRALWHRLVDRGRGKSGNPASGQSGAEGARPGSAREAAYGRAALGAELARVAGAVPGTRNDTLNAAAFALGQLVGGGLLERGAVEEALAAAAVAAGLGRKEARATARSGLDAGQRQPRGMESGELGRGEIRGGPPRSVPGPPGEATAAGGDPVSPGEAEGAYLLAQGADDEGNARCVVHLHGWRFLYCPAYGWLHFTGSHWTRELASPALDRAVVATLQARERLAFQAGQPAIAKASRAMAHRVKATAFLVGSSLPATVDEFDASPDHLNVANGVLDLRSGALAPHDPAQRFTYCLAVDYDAGVDYGPWQAWLRQALAEGGPEEAAGGPGTAGGRAAEAEQYLKLAVGYTLTGHTREEVLFYIYGPPRAGKGTFTEALLTLLDYEPLATEVDFETFTRPRQHDANSADLAKLKPCRLLVASEPGRDDWLNAAQVKRLTGGNLVYAALKYQDHFAYRPAYTIWLTGNTPPRADVEDDAVWSRLRVIHFPNSHIGREDRGLKARMKTPGMQRQILAWAVDGARAWYAAGDQGLPTPPGVEAATRAARAGLDHVGRWLADCVEQTGRQSDFVPNPDLHASYRAWCRAMGLEPLKLAGLTQALRHKGLKAGSQKWHDGKNRRGCPGLRLAGGQT